MAKVIKSKIFNIMQYEVHPETGTPLINEKQIIQALSHKTIKKWAYICHDRDVYSAADEEANPNYVQGQKKGRHWHIVLETTYNSVDVEVIAKWFGITSNFIEFPKGRGAFLDCVQYLTHERDEQQALGKQLYNDNEVVANFDFRHEINKRLEKILKYGKDLNPTQEMERAVFYDGMTLKQCAEQDFEIYSKNMDKLKKLRHEYLAHKPKPKVRQNFYVCGDGGVGKGIISKAMARSMYPDLPDDECFFEVGARGASFEGYDGQPVIIWNDKRAKDLIFDLKDRGTVFDVFDVTPTNAKQNIKYGSVNLCQEVNIVNSVQPWVEFLDDLAGEYEKDGQKYHAEDKGQTYRRFPFITVIEASQYQFYVNRGYLDKDSYEEYQAVLELDVKMKTIAEVSNGRPELKRTLENKAVAPMLEYTDVVKDKYSQKYQHLSDEEILNQFTFESKRPTGKMMINADGEYYVKENDGTSREVQIGVDEVFYNNNWWLINMNTIGEFILQKKTKNGYNIIDLENINLVGCNIK